ncbi:MAG: 30S ribosomal protein S19e [Candidatus Bathyarchaeia archaeon]
MDRLPTVYDVPADRLIKRLASYIKENIGEVTPPAWSLTAKTGSHTEHPPQDPDWWYMRCASILRKLYIKAPIGVSRLRSEYGGRRRRGTSREHVRRGGGSSVREPLQQLEKARLVTKVERKGRRLTSEGVSLLNKIASEIIKESKVAGEG